MSLSLNVISQIRRQLFSFTGWTFRFVLLIALALILASCSEQNFDQSVVRIKTPTGHGTGFVVAKGGYVVTNHHVIWNEKRNKASSSILIYLEHKGNAPYIATVSWKSSIYDLAILRVPDLNAPALTINEGELKKRDKVIAVGFPGGADAIDEKEDAHFIASQTPGQVSRVIKTVWDKRNDTKIRVVQHTAAISGGNSGGPLLNACGEVVAINTSIAKSFLKKDNSVDVKFGTFFSSHAIELARILKLREVPATITSRRCNPQLQSIYLIAGVALTGLIAFAALFFSLRQSPSLQRRMPSLTRMTGIADHQQAAHAGSMAATMLDDGNDFYLVPKGGSERGTEMRIIGEQAKKHGIVIGRQPSAGGITVDDPAASREHVRITSSGKKPYIFYIEDLGSKNGTKVNDRPVAHGAPPTVIRSGDKLRFGSTAYEFLSQGDFNNSRRASGPVGEQWVLTGLDPASGHTISIAFDESHFQKSGNQLIIGRDGDVCDFVISHPTVSNRGHAKISRVGSDLYISDMGTTNGTKVGGVKLGQGGNNAPVQLAKGMSVELGAVKLRVEKNI